MKTFRLTRGLRHMIALAVLVTMAAAPVHAGRIVVNSDEWPTSDLGFTQAGGTNGQAFSQNLASFLDTDGVAGGNVLIFSSNFSLTGGSLTTALTAAGYVPTISTVIPFDLPTLLTFDAVFLAGHAPVDFTALRDYVNAGGGVYIAAGTGAFGGPATEAAFWNPFLADFGLQFADVWDPSTLGLIDPVESTHSLFNGVAQLYYDFGNPVLDLLGTPNSKVLEFSTAGVGLIGIFDDVSAPADSTPPTTTATPAPAPNVSGWNNTNVTVTLNATDNPGGSGVREIQFSLAGAQGGAGVASGDAAPVQISAEGVTTLTFFARDNAGNQEAAKTLTIQIDKTPPVIAGLPAEDCTLWPPDHRLVQVATARASDGLSALAPGSLIVTGTSNEPEDGLGDGDTSPDIVITGSTVQVRAERSGTGTGRLYTLAASASDLAGNRVTITATCTVPHDQR